MATPPIAFLPLEAHHHYLRSLSLSEVSSLRLVSSSFRDICDSYLQVIFGGTIPLGDTHKQKDPREPVDNPFTVRDENSAKVTKQFYLQIHWNAVSIMLQRQQFSPDYNTCQTYEDMESYLEVFYTRLSQAVSHLTEKMPRKRLIDFPKVHALLDHQLSCWITDTAQQAKPGSTQSLTDNRAASLQWAFNNKFIKVLKAYQHIRTPTLKKAVILDYTIVTSSNGALHSNTIFYTAITNSDLKVTNAVLACFAKLLPDFRTMDKCFSPKLFCSIDHTDNLLLKNQNELFIEESTLNIALTVGNARLVRHLMMKNAIYLNTLLSLCNRQMSTWLDDIVLDTIKLGNYKADEETLKIKLMSLNLRKCLVHFRIEENAEQVNQQPAKKARGHSNRTKKP